MNLVLRLIFIFFIINANIKISFAQSRQIEFQAGIVKVPYFYTAFDAIAGKFVDIGNSFRLNNPSYNDDLNFSTQQIKTTTSIIPFTLKLYYHHPVSKNFSISTGIYYLQQGYDKQLSFKYIKDGSITTKAFNYTDSYKYLSIPIQFSYTFNYKKLKPYIGGGIYASYVLSATRSRTVEKTNGPLSNELDDILYWYSFDVSSFKDKLSVGRIILGMQLHVGLRIQTSQRISVTIPELAFIDDFMRSAYIYDESPNNGVPLNIWNMQNPLKRFTVSLGIRYSLK